MTITSVGFDGTVTESDWSRLSAYLGRPPCVADAAALKVTAVVGPDRTVRVAAGVGYGDGVLDTSDATVDVQLAPIASGTRYDAVVARRDWTPPGGTTVFTSVAGTATQALPAGLLVAPGVSADQVIALVQLTAGQSTPTAVVDMRATPTNAVTYPSALALPASAPVGAVADVLGKAYVKGAGGWDSAAVGAIMGTPTSTGANGTASTGVAQHDGVLGYFTFTATAGRRYRAVMDGLELSGSVAGSLWQATIRNSAVVVASSQAYIPVAGGPGEQSVSLSGTFVPGAGSVTLQMVTARLAGTGTATPVGQRELYVVDMGLA